MDLHTSNHNNRPAFLYIDSFERVVELPTNFMRNQARSAKNLAPKSLRLYAAKLHHFCTYLEADEFAHLGFDVAEERATESTIDIDQIIRNLSLSQIDEYFHSLIGSGLKQSTIRGYEVVVRKFADWLTTQEANYAVAQSLYGETSYRTTKPKKKIPRYVTPREVIQLLKSMHFEAQRLVSHFIYDTGLRVSEVPRVLFDDLPDPAAYPESLMYFPLIVRGSKGRGGEIKERITLISRPMLSRFHRHHNSRLFRLNFDFPKDERPALLNTIGERWTSSAITACIRKAGTRANLGQVGPHRLRHGFSFSILSSELGPSIMDNLVILNKALGHTDLATTEVYTHIPAPVLHQMTLSAADKDSRRLYEQSELIINETYLSERLSPKARRVGLKK